MKRRAARGHGSATSGRLAPGRVATVTVAMISAALVPLDSSAGIGASPPSRAVTGSSGDAGVEVEVADVVVSETTRVSTAVVFEISLAEPQEHRIDVTYATQPGSAQADVDYRSDHGTVTFERGDLVVRLPVVVIGDDVDEIDEVFVLGLTSANGRTLDVRATATIVDDDAPPAISVANSVTFEGFTGTHRVPLWLTRPSGKWTHVYCRTRNGTALAGTDYLPRIDQPVQLCAAVRPGDVTAAIAVELVPDAVPETDESFAVDLTRVFGATITGRSASVTIMDDDVVGGTQPTLSVIDETVSESGGRALVWVRLSRPAAFPVTFRLSTVPETASTDDFVEREDTYTLRSGADRVGVMIELTADGLHEDTERMALEVSDVRGAVVVRPRGTVTIADDDPPPIAEVEDAQVVEGDHDVVAAVPVRLTTASARPVEVSYELTGDAPPGPEPSQLRGTVVVRPGELTASIPVLVPGDTEEEPDSAWSVALTAATHAMLGRSTATLTILDDDRRASTSATWS